MECTDGKKVTRQVYFQSQNHADHPQFVGKYKYSAGSVLLECGRIDCLVQFVLGYDYEAVERAALMCDVTCSWLVPTSLGLHNSKVKLSTFFLCLFYINLTLNSFKALKRF